jgi:uncharacterized protein (DUF1810 family)
MTNQLDRFLIAQENSYDHARQELKNGRKTSHWMWYIFPQIKGLGKSDTAKKYEIENLEEATLYLQHQVLGGRILELTQILLENTKDRSAEEVFGFPDFLKLHSSFTLFHFVVNCHQQSFQDPKYQRFEAALQRYFSGELDAKTLALLKKEQ